MLSSLPLQVVVYFNGWYDLLYMLVMLALYVWKAYALPYPGALSGLLTLEVCLVVLLAALEYSRLKLASRGNKTERAGPLIFSMLLAFPSGVLFAFFMLQQIYVLRVDLIMSTIGLVFIAIELLFSLLLFATLGALACASHSRANQPSLCAR